jgi:hypothetical protein
MVFPVRYTFSSNFSAKFGSVLKTKKVANPYEMLPFSSTGNTIRNSDHLSAPLQNKMRTSKGSSRKLYAKSEILHIEGRYGWLCFFIVNLSSCVDKSSEKKGSHLFYLRSCIRSLTSDVCKGGLASRPCHTR